MIKTLVLFLVLHLLPTSRSSAPPSVNSPECPSLSQLLKGSADINNVFSHLGSSSAFKSAWQRHPLHLKAVTPNPQALFNLTTLYDLAGTHVSGHITQKSPDGSWKPSSLNPEQLSGQPLKKSTIDAALTSSPPSTISFNTAGSLFPTIGDFSLSSLAGLEYPVNVNVYITPPTSSSSSSAPGQIVPLHTDRQDVLIFQTLGTKTWTLHPPPPLKRDPSTNAITTHPCTRGKAGDVISPSELSPLSPPYTCVLNPGDVLYVPLGWAHCTSTDCKASMWGKKNADPSVHATLGIDTMVWALTKAALRWGIYSYAGLGYNIDMGKVSDKDYWESMEALPFGFLETETIVDDISDLMKRMQPDREDLPSRNIVEDVVEIFREHKKKIVEVQKRMYTDVDPKTEEGMRKAVQGARDLDMCMAELGLKVKGSAFYEMYREKVMAADKQLALLDKMTT
ncbi:hypothetical protein TrST_g3392 [Triparma strigata]|uniref:Bifunctional lysine-specific demethylase and histidyl-hydroxylase n=1 Tax=Triparma strigata TaxID=1606541 RepID=A0A9W7BQD3_9STRA|nr:hypothetical protein TrST_g3392 [Triparma strigata]